MAEEFWRKAGAAFVEEVAEEGGSAGSRVALTGSVSNSVSDGDSSWSVADLLSP